MRWGSWTGCQPPRSSVSRQRVLDIQQHLASADKARPASMRDGLRGEGIEHLGCQPGCQPTRSARPWEHDYRFLIHDRDSIFSEALDESLEGFGLEILRTPYRAPLANAHCERLVGTFRREFLDHVIANGETHLRRLLFEWIGHYNGARPHSSLGPDIPAVRKKISRIESHSGRKEIAAGARIVSKSVLGGLHHEYSLAAA